jgi:hypothetical protein
MYFAEKLEQMAKNTQENENENRNGRKSEKKKKNGDFYTIGGDFVAPGKIPNTKP